MTSFDTSRAAASAGALHRAAWRWHFYAGLIILPLLVWLATTGALYLYKPEIERFVYRDWIAASAHAPALPAAEVIAAVERQTSARVIDLTVPAVRGESWRVTIEGGAGRQMAFVDPVSGAVLGTTNVGGVMETVKQLHSLAITGPVGNALVEIVAGWAIVLAVTGFILWWPRRATRALRRNGRRARWRQIHGWTGAVVGLALIFLAATGHSWSILWGAAMQTVVAKTESGRPKPPGVTPTNHHAPAVRLHDNSALPWSMQRAAPPMAGHHPTIGVDAAIAIAAEQGIAAPMMVRLPEAAGQPYLISAVTTRSEEAHVVYVDPAGGKVLLDARASDFGWGARAFEWGIATHMGQQYGELNRLAMLAACIGIWLLAATAPVLWWKRRGSRGLSAPPRADPQTMRRIARAMLVLGLFLPLTGLTMIAALVGEWAWRRLRRA